MATNDFLVWAAGTNANVLSQAAYVARSDRPSGVISGTASGQQANKTWRQSSIMATMIAQFIADTLNVNVVDDGTIATIEANFIQAIKDQFVIPNTGVVPGLYPQANVTVEADGRVTAIATGLNSTFAQDTGAQNAAIAALSPVPPSLAALNGVPINIKIAATNSGATTLNLNGKGATAVNDEQGRPLGAGELVSGVIYTLMYNGSYFQLLSRSSVFKDSTNTGIVIDGQTNTNGANLLFKGAGTGGINKTLRVINGSLQVVNNAYTTSLFAVDDTGAVTSAGGIVASAGDVVAVSGRGRFGLGAINSSIPTAAATLSDFVSSLSTPGYQFLPNGFILQWGTSPQDSNSTIVFPLAFPHACLQCMAHEGAPGGWDTGSGELFVTVFGTDTLHTTGARVVIGRYNGQGSPSFQFTVTITTRWIAIGF